MTSNADPRDVVDLRFAETFEEPSDVKAAPSRPADDTRIMGMAPDLWAVMIERKIDAFDTAQRERLESQSANFDAFKGEAIGVLKRVVEVLERLERIERENRDQRTDINANTRDIHGHNDQIAALQRDVAQQDIRITSLERAAARGKKKR